MGVNGAGKTLTLRMIIGDVQPTKGRAWIFGRNTGIRRRRIYNYIGYCPQNDFLLPELTCRQNLKIFALLNGIPFWQVRGFAVKIAVNMGFYHLLDHRFETLPPGNKRQVSSAVALMGNSSVLLLDEPSTGMDSDAKQKLWAALQKARMAGRAIVLTTHDAEECETLCTNSTIMVNGEFRCLGPVQHLKNKYSQGITITLQIMKSEVTDENIEEAVYYITQKFPKAVLT